MLKWYEQTGSSAGGAIYSKVRLARNWNEYAFPPKLSDSDSQEMIGRLEYLLKDLNKMSGKEYSYAYMDDLSELNRAALKARQILNESHMNSKDPMGLIISEDEESSLVLNGVDHIRIQVLEPGLKLTEAWKRAEELDDYLNQRIEYAYDSRYGYLTTFPTNVGTGMKASVLIHLPSLSLGKKFSNMIGEMSRFGTTVKGAYGEGRENYGALYVVSNQKTLGLSEQEIIKLVHNVAGQLLEQEKQVRSMYRNSNSLEYEDEIYKSYGVLKYARRLSMKDAMTFLSQFMVGISDGILKMKDECSVYQLMLGIQQASLQKLSDRPLGKSELDEARAIYLRKELPELI